MRGLDKIFFEKKGDSHMYNYNYYPQTQQSVGQPTQYIPQAYQRPVQPQIGLKGRLVSSLEEARATSIDFDGSIFYFPDLANRRIYTKQINLDGTATLNMYELRELPLTNEQQTFASTNFVTRDEFDSVVAQLKAMLVPEQPVAQAETPKQKVELNF